MLKHPIESNNKKFCLWITIRCNGRKKFWCDLSDIKPNSSYQKRVVEVNGEFEIYMNMPVTPKHMILTICNLADKNDKDFTVELKEGPLKEYAIWLDDESKKFLNLGVYFAQVAGFEAATKAGRKFSTSDDEFIIRYFDVIRDPMNGRAMTTPARVGHTSGIIDASQVRFVPMTVPARLIIELHEFAHKYRNPKMDLAIENEVGADINALYMYLGLGFSKVDAIYVYSNVFLKAQTPGNQERMRKIMGYIKRFENQEFAKLV